MGAVTPAGEGAVGIRLQGAGVYCHHKSTCGLVNGARCRVPYREIFLHADRAPARWPVGCWLQGSTKKKAFYTRKRLKLDQFLALMGDARDHQNSMTIAQQKIALKASRTSLKRVRGACLCYRLCGDQVKPYHTCTLLGSLEATQVMALRFALIDWPCPKLGPLLRCLATIVSSAANSKERLRTEKYPFMCHGPPGPGDEENVACMLAMPACARATQCSAAEICQASAWARRCCSLQLQSKSSSRCCTALACRRRPVLRGRHLWRAARAAAICLAHAGSVRGGSLQDEGPS